MNLFSSRILQAAALALALPILGVSAAVQINGSCYGPGSCSNPGNTTDAIGLNGSISGSTNNNITVNGDSFNVSSTYSASYNGTSETTFFVPTITYTGSSPEVNNDTIQIDFFQDVYDPRPGPFSAGNQTEYITLNVPTSATASGQLFYNGTGLTLVGPLGPGNYQVDNTMAFPAYNGAYLSFDYQFIFNFTAGTTPGTTGGSPTPVFPTAAPEPAELAPLGLVFMGLAIAATRRKR